jgi:hypothetical protein
MGTTARIRLAQSLTTAVLLLAFVSACGCRWMEGGGRAERVLLTRRNASLAQLVAKAERGELISERQLLVTVHERVLRDVLASSLPLEADIAPRLRAHLGAVDVTCDDGLALLRFTGTVRAAAVQDDLAAIVIYADVNLVEIDAATGTLRGRFSPLAFELQKTRLLDGPLFPREWLAELSHLRIDALANLTRTFDLPMQLEQLVRIPGLGAENTISFSSGEIGLGLSVASVWAYDHRLWVALNSRAGAWKKTASAGGT